MDLNNPLSIWIILFGASFYQLIVAGIILYLTLRILKVEEFSYKSFLTKLFIYNILSILVLVILFAQEVVSIWDMMFRALALLYLYNQQLKPKSLALKAAGLNIVLAIVASFLLPVILGLFL